MSTSMLGRRMLALCGPLARLALFRHRSVAANLEEEWLYWLGVDSTTPALLSRRVVSRGESRHCRPAFPADASTLGAWVGESGSNVGIDWKRWEGLGRRSTPLDPPPS